MCLREGADAHEGRRHGDIGLDREVFQLGMRLGRDDATAGIDHGTFGLLDEIEHRAELRVARLGDGADRGIGELDGRRENRHEALLLHVLRNVDDDRTGPPAAGDVEGFLEDARQIGGIHHEVGVLHDRQGHAIEVGLLKGALADELAEHLAGDRHQRNRVHKRVGDSRDEIGGAGAAGGHAHADLALGAGVTLGGEGTALFVARQNRANLVGAGERLVQLLRGAARVSEDHIHALADEALHDDIGPVHFLPDFRRGKGGGRGGGFHGRKRDEWKGQKKASRPGLASVESLSGGRSCQVRKGSRAPYAVSVVGAGSASLAPTLNPFTLCSSISRNSAATNSTPKTA